MRAGLIASGSAIALVAGFGGAAVARAGSDPSANSERFTVVERAITDTTADTGPAGDSLGDVLAFHNPIYTADNTTRIGGDNGSCIRTRVGHAYSCTWTVSLEGGSLAVTGPFYDKRDSQLAVVGGTGRWSDAHGQMTLHARDAAGSAYDFTFDLR